MSNSNNEWDEVSHSVRLMGHVDDPLTTNPNNNDKTNDLQLHSDNYEHNAASIHVTVMMNMRIRGI